MDGTALPEVSFDIGESYAGLIPISDSPHESRQLYFWFFPSKDASAEDEITIWVSLRNCFLASPKSIAETFASNRS